MPGVQTFSGRPKRVRADVSVWRVYNSKDVVLRVDDYQEMAVAVVTPKIARAIAAALIKAADEAEAGQ